MTYVDARVGDFYLLPKFDNESCYELKGKRRDGSLVLRHERTGKQKVILPADFSAMRFDGRAVRIAKASMAVLEKGGLPEVHPETFADTDDSKLSPEQKRSRERLREFLDECRSLRFLSIKHDETEDAPRSTAALQRFIDEHWEEMQSRGLCWKPSPSAVRRALDRYGVRGDRPLDAFLDRRRRHFLTPRWHKIVVDLKSEMIRLFWSDRKKALKHAIDFFYGQFDLLARARVQSGEKPIARPTRETLRTWINSSQCWENWKTKYGEREANRKFRGRGFHAKADHILETVIIDHTRLDDWCKIVDEDGNQIMVERPWLTIAIDVCSRSVLAAILTPDPPSILTLRECMLEIFTPKRWLVERFGEHAGADACGKPFTLVLDNDWAHTGVSLQVYAEALGINLIFAPVRNPEYKAIGERIFRTINEGCIHRLPGAIPHKPSEMSARDLDPRADELLTIDEVRERIWLFIVTIYHMEVHEGIGMQPARAWQRGVNRGEWVSIDDINAASKFLGHTKRRTLDATGIHINGHRFHSQVEVSELLDSLLRYSAGRRRKEKPLSSGTVPVVVTTDPSTCEYVHVWDFARKRNVKLYNTDERFSQGCSWRLAEAVKKAAEAENRAFQTDEEKWEARRIYEASLVPSMKDASLKEQRKLLRNLPRKKPRLAMGDTVETSTADPSVSGMNPGAIKTAIPAAMRIDDRIPPFGPRRGGRASSKRASTKGKRQRKTGTQTGGTTVSMAQNPEPRLVSSNSLHCLADHEAEALLAELTAELKSSES